jgi:hypothetical protein
MSEPSASEPAFDDVRTILKVRVLPEDAMPGPEDQPLLVARPLAAGLQEVLVLDFPGVIAAATPALLEKWGRPADELFALGLANVAEQDKPEVSLVKDSLIRAMTGESFFVATWVLLLDKLFKDLPVNGGLVSIPNRKAMLFRPILDITVAPDIGPFVAMTDMLFREGQGGVSSDIYWWHGGAMTLLPSKVTDAGIEFTPPDDFIDMIQALAAQA